MKTEDITTQVKTGIQDGDFVWSSSWPAVSENRFHFNSKEDQSLFGTPYIDYGARQYDPAIARWNAVDPLAEKYYPVTPYVFCADNAVNNIDENGKRWVDVKGNLVWDKGNWTEYATSDQIKIAEIMRSTLTGSEQFSKLVRSKYDIIVTIDYNNAKRNKNDDFVMGETKRRTYENNGSVKNMQIIIYKLNASQRLEYIRGELDLYESMAVNFAHEIEHTTEEAIQLSKKGATVEEKEKSPIMIGNMIISEFKLPAFDLTSFSDEKFPDFLRKK